MHARARVDMFADMCASMRADICSDICVDMCVCACVCKCVYRYAKAMQMAICMRIHALAHVCRWTPNAVDAKLAGSAVLGRILAKRRHLPHLYTENTVLFGTLACRIGLVAHMPPTGTSHS